MTCQKAEEAIDLLLDSPAEPMHSALRRHLDACVACREVYESLRELQSSLGSLPSLDCPPEVTRRVMAQVRARRYDNIRSRLIDAARPLVTPAWRPALAAAIVVALLAVPVFREHMSRQAEEYTAVEVAEGLREAKIAFAYIGEAGRRTGTAVREEAIESGVIAPMRLAVSTAVSGSVH
jgi:hypothetical protein